ncbi:unnamed protein product [Aureobasidium uvarum]|uniref:F-box domain-containing protein n=1 Tax=Aureobasidium uvarum TaxID=2773716 RepID=A0A9N8KP70_9PEZI|nr:unnamed protein product [Aureobasidium uvarum]
MPTTINHVPNEALKHILVQVREQGGYDALRMALLVSRLWNDAGSPVLYQHVVLHNGNISSFLDSTFEQYVNIWAFTDQIHKLTCYGHRHCEREASNTFQEAKEMYTKPLPSVGELEARHKRRIRNRERTWDHVHSLTLNIKPEGTGHADHEERNRLESGKLTPLDLRLARLASMLPGQFRLLETFSLFTEEVYIKDRNNLERGGPGFLDTRVVLELVRSLPKSCTSLMLDTNAREIQFGGMSSRMCLMLREMMPRLRHLSLRVSYVCESMIIKSQEENKEPDYVHAPHLRSLSISFVPRNVPYWFDLMYARNVCRRTHFDATIRLPNDHPLGSNDESGTIRLARALQKAQTQGCFPRAKSIQVVSSMRILHRNYPHSQRESDEMMIVRDCVQDKTHALRFIPSHRSFIHDEDRAIIDRYGVFAMGNHESLKLFSEAGKWATIASYKARLPIDTPEAQFEKCSLKTLSTGKELEYFIESLARETHEKLVELHKDLTEGERHPGRVFEFDGAAFPFKDFMPGNL